MNPIKFLFVTIEGGGNLPQMFGLAKKMLERGHTITFLTEPCLEQPVKEMNCDFIPFNDYFVKKERKEDVLRDWNATLMKNPVFDNVVFGPAETVVKQTMSAINSADADMLVVDLLLPPALIAAEAMKIPRILVFHMPEYLPGPNRPPGNMGLKPGKGWLIKMRDQFLARMMNAKFNEYKPKLNKIRDQLHLPPLENTLDIFHSADFRIIQTLRSFDTPILPPPVNVRYSGPILDDPDWAATKQWNAPWDQSDRRPLVVISFSSTFQNQAPVIQKSIDALKGLHVKGLVTLGMAMENEDFNIPENVFVMNTARHSEVFPHADVVITHAGHGTVIRALAHGVPLICLPLGRDQNDNAIKVEMKGCGIKLSPGAKVSAISKAVGKILTDADFKLNAGKLKEELSRSDGFDALLTEIEQYSLQHKKHIKDTETVK